MKVTEQPLELDGHRLHRTFFDPDDGEPQMVCIFTHGQGDYSERYADVLHPFTDRGIRCISIDLRGHGMSSGRRGHCGNIEFYENMVQSNMELIGDLPYGIAGHSMGALLTLYLLDKALDGEIPMPKFCWVNSPLLKPAHGRPDWFIKVAKGLAKVAPAITIKTGATPELCQTMPDGVPTKPDPNSIGHNRVSLGWGTSLMRISDHVYANLLEKTSTIPFLFTQGDTDFICPHAIGEEFFEKLKFTNKTFQLFHEMRHETFAEPNNHELFEAMESWLDKFIPTQT